MSTILFTDDENNTKEYEIIESTTLGGSTYLLVADEEDNAYIFREETDPGDDEGNAAYTEDLTDAEYDAVAAVFSQLLGEEDIELTR
ncbi:MAG: DUF1292 domain-containing protein [Lachnospiraceae bacterium]|nr:DUF1292 domain-containing protein [Lachnospiraceae bacterium]